MAVTAACEEVRDSRGFASFLEMVLLVANFMGAASRTHKDAFAFEMSTLPKVGLWLDSKEDASRGR